MTQTDKGKWVLFSMDSFYDLYICKIYRCLPGTIKIKAYCGIVECDFSSHGYHRIFFTCSDQIYTLNDEQMSTSAWVGLEDYPVVVDSENLFKGSLLHDSSADCCSRRIVSKIVFFTSTWANDAICILFFCFNHQLALVWEITSSKMTHYSQRILHCLHPTELYNMFIILNPKSRFSRWFSFPKGSKRLISCWLQPLLLQGSISKCGFDL